MTKPNQARAKHPPLTDAERHERFVEMGRETGADEKQEAFDRAFSTVVKPPKRKA